MRLVSWSTVFYILSDEITLELRNDRVYRKCACEKVNGLESFPTEYSDTFSLVNSPQKTSPDHRESLVQRDV